MSPSSHFWFLLLLRNKKWQRITSLSSCFVRFYWQSSKVRANVLLFDSHTYTHKYMCVCVFLQAINSFPSIYVLIACNDLNIDICAKQWECEIIICFPRTSSFQILQKAHIIKNAHCSLMKKVSPCDSYACLAHEINRWIESLDAWFPSSTRYSFFFVNITETGD